MLPHRNQTPTCPPPRRVVGCAGPSIGRGGPLRPPSLAILMPKKDRPPRPAQSGAPMAASAEPPKRHKVVELRKASAGRLGQDGRDLGGLRRRPPSSLRAPVLLLPACLSVPCCLTRSSCSMCAQVNGPRCARAGPGSGMRRMT